MNAMLCALVAVTGIPGLPPETVDSVAAIDLIVSDIESMNLIIRPIEVTWPPVQGPGYTSTEVVLHEERHEELVGDRLIETDILRLLECSYDYTDNRVTARYYFDAGGNLILCASTWDRTGPDELLCEDRFYFSHDQVLACSYDGSLPAMPVEEDLERAYARIEHCRHIVEEIGELTLPAPSMFRERFDSVYELTGD